MAQLKTEQEPLRRSQPLLGTFVTITAYGKEAPRTQDAIDAAFEEVRRVDHLLSIHKPESEISRVNSAAAARSVSISTELRAILEQALEISRITEGAFDPSIGPLAELWGFIWKEYRLPTESELERMLPLVDYAQIHLSATGGDGTVRFGRDGMFLDFGGMGKGYAVDRAIDVLRQHSIEAAMVRAGGDLRVFGTPPGEEAWQVQMEDPEKKGRRVTISLSDTALSTSGNYENFFEVNGRRYSHIVDPRTGLPVEGIASCTVIAPTCTESDAYATAFFVLGIQPALQKFSDSFAIRFVDDRLRVFQSPSFPREQAR